MDLFYKKMNHRRKGGVSVQLEQLQLCRVETLWKLAASEHVDTTELCVQEWSGWEISGCAYAKILKEKKL